jgi:hypothetical protein
VDDPLISLLAAVFGLAGGVLLVSSLLKPQWPGRRRWVVANSVVVLVALGVGLPGKLHASLDVLDAKHDANSMTYEQQAHERCLQDMGRADLGEALAFARRRMGEDASYYASTSSPSLACVILNLMPRRPVREVDFDPAHDWIVLDGVAPEQLGGTLGEQARRADRFVSYSDSFKLLPPEGDAQ